MPKWNLGAIRKNHVRQAARQWVRDQGFSTFRDSRLYLVEVDGKFYPPKAIGSLAYLLATGVTVGPSEFVGAREGAWHKCLQGLGFDIHLKAESAPECPDEVTQKFTEGHGKQVWVNRYERDPGARAACVRHWGARCHVCSLAFEERYGALAKGFIHVHHLRPLSEIGKSYQVDPKNDLRPVCPNCHAMLHRSGLSIGRLRRLLGQQV